MTYSAGTSTEGPAGADTPELGALPGVVCANTGADAVPKISRPAAAATAVERTRARVVCEVGMAFIASIQKNENRLFLLTAPNIGVTGDSTAGASPVVSDGTVGALMT